MRFRDCTYLLQSLLLCVAHFHEQPDVVVDYGREVRVRVPGVTGAFQEYVHHPPHQRLCIGKAVAQAQLSKRKR